MDTTETATRGPDQALLQADSLTRPGAERGLSENANRTNLLDVDLLVEYSSQAGSAGFTATHRHTDAFAERLRSTFQQAHARA